MTGTDLRLSALEQFPNAYIVIRDNNYNVPKIEETKIENENIVLGS